MYGCHWSLRGGDERAVETAWPDKCSCGFSTSPDAFQLTVQSLLHDFMIAEACISVGIVVYVDAYKGKDSGACLLQLPPVAIVMQISVSITSVGKACLCYCT
ncbi:hypothetical protein [Paenibacillus sp. 481]|uniref:hypothetical protein n=1 Tax=Paenibacillus sp. 481 TaxID=2835869 RepID=UPI001E2BAEA9|nr:hypothetical protein [Paenibacillus sp. 481]UHA73097.1 hypothetical protein KIK04_21265 [Paenibacillus sp. 481]